MNLNRYTCAVTGIMLGFALSIPMGLALSPAAYAAPAPPNLSAGYYVSTANTQTAYNLGCVDGEYDTAHGYGIRLAILDFGAETSSGTELINSTLISDAQIEAVAENYGLGYYNCSGSTQRMTVSVGTNNSAGNVSYSGGQAWHDVLHGIWVSSTAADILSQVNFVGGNDIEAFPGATPSPVIAWANGWEASTTGLYLDFGSADGCSETGYSGGSGIGCNNGFNQYDYWYLSWGLPDAIAEPEIYAPGMAPEWKWICIYGNNVQGKPISFEGPLNEYYLAHDYTPGQSWSDLWNALNGTVCAQTPPFETSMKDE